MRGLGNMIGILAVALIALVIYKFYFAQSVQVGGANGATPTQTVNTVGVQNDLLAIAQAERLYQAQHGSYGTFDDLVSSGAMSMQKSGRDGYTYSVETSADGFRAIAQCPTAASPGCKSYAVDNSMQVQPIP